VFAPRCSAPKKEQNIGIIFQFPFFTKLWADPHPSSEYLHRMATFLVTIRWQMALLRISIKFILVLGHHHHTICLNQVVIPREMTSWLNEIVAARGLWWLLTSWQWSVLFLVRACERWAMYLMHDGLASWATPRMHASIHLPLQAEWSFDSLHNAVCLRVSRSRARIMT